MRVPRSLALPLALCAVLAAGAVDAQTLPLRPASMPASHPGAESPDTWAVRLRPGADPDSAAAAAGARNLGQIAKLADTYLFHIPGGAARSAQTDQRLAGTDAIVWREQQIPLQRQTRLPADPLFANQWHLRRGSLATVDANVEPAWDLGVFGASVVIAVADTGVAHAHPDLAPNYRAALSWDFNGNDANPNDSDGHGTSAAGVAAARDDGSSCGVGAAYRAGIAGLRLIDGSVTDAVEAEALTWHPDEIAISSNSWGPFDTGNVVEGPGPLTLAAMEQAAQTGRDGLGTIWVWAAGNGGTGDDVGADGYASMRQTIAVAGVTNQGGVPYYGEPGSALLIAAPTNGGSRGITTTSLNNNCTNSFGGTSSAAPLAAGVVALILDARPQLTWRDVQHVLVQTAVKVNPGHAGWFDNAAGLHFNEFFGFGMVDAGAAVELASEWDLVGEALESVSAVRTPGLAMPQVGAGSGATDSIVVDSDIVATEHVEVVFSATHQRRGEMEVTLISPSGTAIRLLRSRANDSATSGFTNWKFTANTFWGEDPNGTWTLRVRDATNNARTGTWTNWQLIVRGTGVDGPQPVGVLTGDGDFADVEVGDSGLATLTLTSDGDAALIVDSAATLDDATHFAIDGSTCAAATDLGTDGSCTIDVRFAPQAAGPHATTLRIATNAGEFTLALSGTGIEADGDLVGPPAFPSTRLGASSASSYTLTSTGTAPLLVTDGPTLDDATHFALDAVTCTPGADLQLDGSCTVAVRFVPTAVGTLTTTLHVATNAGDRAIVLTGEAIDPDGALSGDGSFGERIVGSAAITRTLTLTSDGTSPLLLDGVATLDDGTQFTLVASTCTDALELVPGATCSIDVGFAPQAVGAHTTTLRIDSNAGEFTFALDGSGIEPQAALGGDGFFGDAAIDGGSVTRSFTLSSNGATALRVDVAALDVGGTFRIAGNGCSAALELAPGEQCTIDVRFDPATIGAHADVLRVATNAGEYTLALAGNGIDLRAELVGDAAFDDARVGTTGGAKVLTLRGTGATPLVLDAAPALDDDTHFAIVGGSCAAGVVLSANHTCTVQLRFVPQARGALATTLRIATNAGEYAADLSGTGTVSVAILADGFEAAD